MKNNKLTNIFLVLCTTTLITACHKTRHILKSKPVADCSTIFESGTASKSNSQSQAQTSNKDSSKLLTSENQGGADLSKENMEDSLSNENQEEAIECKVLPIKLNKETNCEIAGSDSVKNLTDSLYENAGEKTILIASVGDLTEEMSYKNQMIAHVVQMRLDKHFNSDLADSFDKYRYKGMSCDSAKGKMVAWIGEGRVVATFEDKPGAKKSEADKADSKKSEADKSDSKKSDSKKSDKKDSKKSGTKKSDKKQAK